ncbi:unnamed protein product [Amoebophrya sp. A120]|nr:unnamed protein product [Amoebophrya sp. A120]|eukprot:GSA120T00017911001.1
MSSWSSGLRRAEPLPPLNQPEQICELQPQHMGALTYSFFFVWCFILWWEFPADKCLVPFDPNTTPPPLPASAAQGLLSLQKAAAAVENQVEAGGGTSANLRRAAAGSRSASSLADFYAIGRIPLNPAVFQLQGQGVNDARPPASTSSQRGGVGDVWRKLGITTAEERTKPDRADASSRRLSAAPARLRQDDGGDVPHAESMWEYASSATLGAAPPGSTAFSHGKPQLIAEPPRSLSKEESDALLSAAKARTAPTTLKQSTRDVCYLHLIRPETPVTGPAYLLLGPLQNFYLRHVLLVFFLSAFMGLVSLCKARLLHNINRVNLLSFCSLSWFFFVAYVATAVVFSRWMPWQVYDDELPGRGVVPWLLFYIVSGLVVLQILVPALLLIAICGCLPCLPCCAPFVLHVFRRQILRGDTRGRSARSVAQTLSRCVTYKLSESDPAHGENCSICLQELEAGHEVGEAPCTHVFHRECLEKWASFGGSNCPVCRETLARPEDGQFPLLTGDRIATERREVRPLGTSASGLDEASASSPAGAPL